MPEAEAGEPVQPAEQETELALFPGVAGLDGIVHQCLEGAPLGPGGVRDFRDKPDGESAEDPAPSSDEERGHGPKLALLAAPGSAP